MYSLDRINRISNEEYENKVSFIKIKKEYSLKNDNKFNIFTSLSKCYYKENLHNDILKLIFDPITERIGNYEYLNGFINFINKTLNIKLDYKSVVVEREKDRIDIFIHDDNKIGIIIENKINNTPDRKNQIEKYYKIAKK